MKISGILALLHGTLAATAAAAPVVVDVKLDNATQSSPPPSADFPSPSLSSSFSARHSFQPSSAFTPERQDKIRAALAAAALMTRNAARVARSNRTRLREFFGPIPHHYMFDMQRVIAGRFDLMADACRAILADLAVSADADAHANNEGVSYVYRHRRVMIAYNAMACDTDDDTDTDDDDTDDADDAAVIDSYTDLSESISPSGDGSSDDDGGTALIVFCPAAMDRLPTTPARPNAPSLVGRLIHQLTHALFRTDDNFLTPGVPPSPPPYEDDTVAPPAEEPLDSNSERKSDNHHRHHPKHRNRPHGFLSAFTNADTYQWFALDALLQQVPSLDRPYRYFYRVAQDKDLAAPPPPPVEEESNNIKP